MAAILRRPIPTTVLALVFFIVQHALSVSSACVPIPPLSNSTTTLPTTALATIQSSYTLSDNVVGSGFNNFFDWQAIADPTNGRVNYVDAATAQRLGLAKSTEDTFTLSADSTTALSASGPGRNSFRIRSKKTFGKHVAIFDVKHMPVGCGTWPAIWETKEAGWPNGGEIDILEGVNDQGPNAATLHTLPGCTMSANQVGQSGVFEQLDCNYLINGNNGCKVKDQRAQSYGNALNAAGGGWFALERSDSFIKLWFWPRAGSAPTDVKVGGNQVNTAEWGLPVAYFSNESCDFAKFFDKHNIIINLTFCGDWAGGKFTENGCPGTCVDYVNNNPAAFKEAYFEFGSIRVYT